MHMLSMFEFFWHCVLMIFCFFPKELRLIFPNSQRLNRGNYVLSQLVQACRANEVTDLILVHEHRGEPGRLTICNLITNLDIGWSRSLSTFCLIWKDIKIMPNQVTFLVRKTRNILSLQSSWWPIYLYVQVRFTALKWLSLVFYLFGHYM